MLEVVGISSILEKIYLGEQLLFLLFQLGDFLLQFRRVHALLTKSLRIGVNSLELCLQVLVNLQRIAHILIVHVLVGNL